MPRTARTLVDGGVYHVVTRGNNGQAVFREDADYQFYLRTLSTYTLAHQVTVRHFVLMPEHVQLVLDVARGASLSKVMLGINLTYTLFYRRRYQYRGHLWQGRFESLLLNPETDLLLCGRHVELAPVRAGLATNPTVHTWSSYHVYAAGAEMPPVVPHGLYESLGSTSAERQQRYRQLIQDGMQEALALSSTRARVSEGASETPNGQDGRFGLLAIRRTRGRPRKVDVATYREMP